MSSVRSRLKLACTCTWNSVRTGQNYWKFWSLVRISFERRHEATRSFYPICIHASRSLILRGSKQRNLRSRAASETGGAERSRTSCATVLVGFIFWNSLYVGAHQPARKYSPALGSCIFISSGRTQDSDRNNGHGFRRDTRPNLF